MRVSVCLAAFNGGLFIDRQIRSIQNQLSNNDELIIVNDSSTDNTLEIINSFLDHRIKLINNDTNIGVAASFNLALQHATGDYIFMSDQDDYWYDNKVYTILQQFNLTNSDLIVHDATVIIKNQAAQSSLFEMFGSSSGIFHNIYSNRYTGCCMAFRRDILYFVLPIPAYIGVFHDAWIGILSELFGRKTFFLKIRLIDFVRHSNNASSFKRRKISLVIMSRIFFLYGILSRVIYIYYYILINKIFRYK